MFKRIFDNLITPSSGTRFPALDGLRGLACLAIVLFHIPSATGMSKPEQWAPMTNAVTVFFALSAFLLYYPWAKDKPIVIKPYYIRRFCRIVPAYVGALLFASILKMPSARDFISHLFFVHTFSWNTVVSIIPPAWSMATEVQFYIILPLLALLFARNPYPWLITSILVGIGLQFIPFLHSTLSYPNLPFLLLPFLSGMFAAWLVANRPQYCRNLFWIGVIGTIFYMASWHFLGRSDIFLEKGTPPFNMRGVITSCSAAMMICGLAVRPNRFFTFPPIRLCGIFGYGIFLLHVPSIIYMDSIFGHVPARILAFPVAILLGMLSYLLIEAPFIRLGARLANQHALPP